jgi:hypothetical protein
LILREKYSLKIFENRVLRRFGYKEEEMTGGWGKLFNKELHKLYSLPDVLGQ